MNSSAELATEEFCPRFPRVNLSDSNRRIAARGAQVVRSLPIHISVHQQPEKRIQPRYLARLGFGLSLANLDDNNICFSLRVRQEFPKAKQSMNDSNVDRHSLL
jgi:hypothetical protein